LIHGKSTAVCRSNTIFAYMPLVNQEVYPKPIYLFNEHLETVVPSLLRKEGGVPYVRERITTPDQDFMDLDWWKHEGAQSSRKLILLSHGLEGSSQRPYMVGMARLFFAAGWDVLAWNCRSCSGALNLAPRLYHHGDAADLHTVVQHAVNTYNPTQLGLIGFSMGGSLILKYLGQYASTLPNSILGGIVFSVPIDLGSSARALSNKGNGLYRKRFLTKLKHKIQLKAQQHPNLIDLTGIEGIAHFEAFDNQFTAPLHGFENAQAFYKNGSALFYLDAINKPTLLVNALNDPMLPEACYPYEQARQSKYLHFSTPKYGGHVGWAGPYQKIAWSEARALTFANAFWDA